MTQVPDEASSSFNFKGHIVKDSDKQRSDAESACSYFVTNLVSNLNARFSSNQDTSVLLSMCQIFYPLVFAKPASDLFLNSVNEVAVFQASTSTCKSIVDDVKEEIVSFCHQIVENHGKIANSVNDVCQLAIKQGSNFPIVKDIAMRFLCLPVSSVECERGFSKQNLIKTKLRNRLATKVLENLMIISIDGPDQSDFCFTKAFQKWAENPHRILM
ncbi:hypothetical protein KUTeg_008400 [Tegillarca granosa]|uniref:HAT C-terminal dimerisation domain-containing protein n=1 Tax=Tegillarca granosa TaxID=220873 RepID=A0ABQ9F922_TEGGR|nr:hypothetical protein KUTeg_008400 [Tegillarca granosa]